MRIGVLGTGVVGETLATKLAELGHDVGMGAREAENEKAAAWADRTDGFHGTFADAAARAELVLNCTGGAVSLQALERAGEENLRGRVLVDVSNPLDFSQGFPPTLTVANTDSIGEQIQRRFPETRVVKALNTVTAGLMVEPSLLPEPHDLFMAGNDDGAKHEVAGLLESFGWARERIHDLGGIEAARGTEMYLALWVRMMGAFGSPRFNVRVVRER